MTLRHVIDFLIGSRYSLIESDRNGQPFRPNDSRYYMCGGYADTCNHRYLFRVCFCKNRSGYGCH